MKADLMLSIETGSTNRTYPQQDVFVLYYVGPHGSVILGVFGSEVDVKAKMDELILHPFGSMTTPGVGWSRVPMNDTIDDMDLTVMLSVLEDENGVE